ncbi:glycosyltransferase [Pseudonocardia sp. CA-107938]|uniref:glycosyltransferase n=1 Tax=Pseudonocardia sp. CA-107938 TaxID=3240021 RepID=UPI003D946BE3
MRLLLTTWGSRGDVEPLAGLAVALREHGADAVVCAPPDDDFVALLGRVGVAHEPLGPSVRSVVSGGRTDPFQLAADLVAARFETLGRVGKGCDAILACGLMPAGAPDVAEKLGIDYHYVSFHMAGLPSRVFSPGVRPGTPSSAEETDKRVLWQQDAERVTNLYGPAVNSHRAELGMPPVDNVRDQVFTARPFLAADPTLCPSAGMTELDLVQTGAWILPDDRPLPDDLAAFLDAGTPPVYVGFGSMAAHAPKGVAEAAIEAARGHGRRILIGSGWAGLTSADDADDCFVVGEVNQQALFRRVATVVHHGGAGTTTTAARAGAPQVIVPLIADQPYWASRIAELGIGAAHEGAQPTAESLSAALAVSLDPQVQERAVALAGEVRTDGATVAAQLLLASRVPETAG